MKDIPLRLIRRRGKALYHLFHCRPVPGVYWAWEEMQDKVKSATYGGGCSMPKALVTRNRFQGPVFSLQDYLIRTLRFF